MNRFTLTNVTTPAAALDAMRPDAEVKPLDFSWLNAKRPLAGGSDLLAEIKEGIIRPGTLVNLKTITGWSGIRPGADDALEIGATTLIADVAASDVVRAHSAALADAAEHVGSPQIRNQGTVGGNLCQRPRCWYYRHGDTQCLKKGGVSCFAKEGENKYHAVFATNAPCVMASSTNLGVALLALGGKLIVQSLAGEKAVAAEHFYRLPTAEDPYRETVLEPGEIVSGISVPESAGSRSAYMQISEKADFDWALVSAATRVKLDGAGAIENIALAMNAIAPVPWRLTRAEEFLRDKRPDIETLRAAAKEAFADARPLSQNAYKVAIAKALLVRVVQRAIGAHL